MGCLTVTFERTGGGGSVGLERNGGIDAGFARQGGMNASFSQVCDIPIPGVRFYASDGAFLTKEGYSIIVKAI